MFTSRCQNREKNYKDRNKQVLVVYDMFKCCDEAVKYKNLHPHKIKIRFNSEEWYYPYSGSFTFPSNFQHFKIEVYETIVLRHVLQLCETYCVNHALSVFENKVLRRISGPNV